MSAPSNPVRVGIVGSTPIIAELGLGVRGGGDALVSVTLGADYVLENPPGYPFRPPAGGAAPFYPHTVTSGSTIQLLAPEANALIAAGAATAA